MSDFSSSFCHRLNCCLNHYVPRVIDKLTTQVAKHVSDQGNQNNNGPHQDQIFDNLSALCFALWAKNRIRFLEGVGTDAPNAPNKLFMKCVE